MAGTKLGGQKTAATNKARHGQDYYQRIALKANESYMAKPKEERKPRGFAHSRKLAIEAGAKGGRISKRIKR